MPVLAGALRPTHLDAQDQPDVIEPDLGEPLEPDRPSEVLPLWPWSSSMTRTRSQQPQATARSARAY